MSSHYSSDNVAPVALVPLQSQDLSRLLIGKWTIYKYQFNLQVPFLKSRVEFLSDGSFKSDGMFFGGNTGRFQTDNTKFIIVVYTESGVKEWRVTLRSNTIQLKSDLARDASCINLIKENKK